MEVSVITTILTYLTQGGTIAVITILFGIVCLLIWERRKLNAQLAATTLLVYAAKDKETESIREIIDKYYEGNIDLINALNEIKTVLVTMQSTKR